MRGALAGVAAILAVSMGAATALAYFSATKTSPQPISIAVIDSVTLVDPGPYVRGTVVFTAEATASNGVREVEFQARPVGSSGWTSFGTDRTSPYTASYNTSTAPDGDYEVRAVMTAVGGATTISPVITVTSDNTAPVGDDVQAERKSGGTSGRPEAGDRVLLSWSEPMDPGSLVDGWDESSSATVYAKLVDGSGQGTGANEDWLFFYENPVGTDATGLGKIDLGGNYINGGSTVTFTSTIALDREGTTATVTLGNASGSGLRTDNTSRRMEWTPANAARDLAGNRCSTATVSESGFPDRDF